MPVQPADDELGVVVHNYDEYCGGVIDLGNVLSCMQI
jgi:hypothetical protein